MIAALIVLVGVLAFVLARQRAFRLALDAQWQRLDALVVDLERLRQQTHDHDDQIQRLSARLTWFERQLAVQRCLHAVSLDDIDRDVVTIDGHLTVAVWEREVPGHDTHR